MAWTKSNPSPKALAQERDEIRRARWVVVALCRMVARDGQNPTARAVGVGRTTLLRWLAGERLPRGEILARVEGAMREVKP